MNNQILKTLLSLILFVGFSFQISAQVAYSSDLKATEDEMGNLLQWTTSNEINSKHFIVEKSKDNVNFAKIATVDARRNSSKNNAYVYLDMDLASVDEQITYRLRQVDMDDAYSYSNQISMSKTVKNHFSMNGYTMTENPNEYNLSYTCKVGGEMNMEVIDAVNSSIVHSENFMASEGYNEVIVDLQNFKVGTYEVVFTLDNEKEIIAINKTGKDSQKMLSRKAGEKIFRN